MEVVRETPLLLLFRRLRQLLKVVMFCLLIGSFAILLTILYLRSQPLPDASIHQTSTIYAREGEVLDKLHHGENRTVVPLTEIAPTMVQATLAIEDRSFYTHVGFDFKRTAMAVYVNLREMDKSQGASTITQQLARNLYLTLDKTWERKFREALLTVQLEINYSKDEIIEMYMNQIYFGHSAYGVQAAAQTYFGKEAKELTLAESAMLAGIPKGPTYYSPHNHYENAKHRQKLILQAMQRDGYITLEQAEAAYAKKLTFRDLQETKQVTQAPYFRDYIATLAKERYGIDEETFRNGGLQIYTTLDFAMQKKAEAAIKKYLPKKYPDLQVALVAMHPRTGEIKAMVGGRDYNKSQYNRAFSKRQPGSSFKPFLYLAALENGFTPITLMKSEPTVFTYDRDKEYIPSNFGDRYAHDYITLQKAIATSDNIYAVKTIDQLTPQKLVEEANELGITSPLQAVPSLALGTSPVSVFDMTVAYSTIANKGERVKPIAITRIEDSQGNVLVEERTETSQVADPKATFLLTQMMQSVFEHGGTANRVSNQLKRPMAGKTGTTDYDSWLSGFTPQLVSTVWLGYDEGRTVDINESRPAAQIWAAFMEASLADEPVTLFDIPAGVVSMYINPDNGKLATEHCPNPQMVYFAVGTEPTEYCTEHLPTPGEEPKPLQSPKEQSFWQRIGEIWGGQEQEMH